MYNGGESMKTLIELFDERPLENVIGTEMFTPEKTVYICPHNVIINKTIQHKLREYFKKRGINTRCVFEEAAVLKPYSVAATLEKVIASNSDCVLDITGGSESALFAAGLVCADNDVPVITYSRKQGRFFTLRGSIPELSSTKKVILSVEDCFLMAGGSLREGRVDNSVLADYNGLYEPFFNVYLKHRKEWISSVVWFQRASRQRSDEPVRLDIRCSWTQKAERGGSYAISPDILCDLQKIGMLKDLNVSDSEKVSFSFADAQVRTWLRDVGSVLELYVYKAARDTGLFSDVVSSAIVDWEGENQSGDVTNEIDVMATRGVVPFFISCKICDVKTEALNELAILRDRFGGKMSRAAIVTAEYGGTAMRHRAEELDIDVVDLSDLKGGWLKKRLIALTREEK